MRPLVDGTVCRWAISSFGRGGAHSIPSSGGAMVSPGGTHRLDGLGLILEMIYIRMMVPCADPLWWCTVGPDCSL